MADVGERLITDRDGELVVLGVAGRNGHTVGSVEGLVGGAQPDPDAVTEEFVEGLAPVLDRGAVVVEAEDLLGGLARLGPTERAVLAHADPVAEAATLERDDRDVVIGVHRGGRGHREARSEEAQSDESDE